jgi:hypothetical protein
MPFGKMKGQPLVCVFQDVEYMEWMATRVRNPSGIMSEVIKLFREYIKEEKLSWNKIRYDVLEGDDEGDDLLSDLLGGGGRGIVGSGSSSMKNPRHNYSSFILEPMEILGAFPPVATAGCLNGHAVVVTGETERLTKGGWGKFIKAMGGDNPDTVSDRTTMLVYGKVLEDGRPVETGSEWREAQEQNVKGVEGRGYNVLWGKGKGKGVFMGLIDIYSEAEFCAWLEATATPEQHQTAQVRNMRCMGGGNNSKTVDLAKNLRDDKDLINIMPYGKLSDMIWECYI